MPEVTSFITRLFFGIKKDTKSSEKVSKLAILLECRLPNAAGLWTPRLRLGEVTLKERSFMTHTEYFYTIIFVMRLVIVVLICSLAKSITLTVHFLF